MKEFWPILEGGIVTFPNELFIGEIFSIRNPKMLRDYRSISLMGCEYTIIKKNLVIKEAKERVARYYKSNPKYYIYYS